MRRIIFFTLSLLSSVSFAQKSKSESKTNAQYYIHPLWIAMMDDPNTNYYEACKAFYAYWEGKIVPAETEGEAMDLGKVENIRGQEKEKEIPEESQRYVYEYKQFKHWELTMKNMIDVETGRIMSIDEVQNLITKERNKK
jgi:hypothetical protein